MREGTRNKLVFRCPLHHTQRYRLYQDDFTKRHQEQQVGTLGRGEAEDSYQA